MALKGQAKTDYQREYMREYQRARRGSKQKEAGLNKETRHIIPANSGVGSKQPDPKPVRPTPSLLPNCSDDKFRPTDADGEEIPEYW